MSNPYRDLSEEKVTNTTDNNRKVKKKTYSQQQLAMC